MVSRVLVTGATGGIGLALVQALVAAGCEVVATGRKPAAGARLAAAGAEFRAADLTRDPLAPLLEGVDIVYHLAARSAPWGPRQAFEADNVGATERLLDAAAAAGVRRFVFTSTPSIYAERRDRLDLTETSPVAAVFSGHYARTKYQAERRVLARNAPGFATVALRPRAVVGPDDAVLLPRIARVAARGWTPMPRGGEALVELTDVRDVVSALLAAGRPDAPSGVAINLSGGQPRRFGDLVASVCGLLNTPYRPIVVPEPVLYGGARLAEVAAGLTGREPAVTRHSAMVISWSQTFDLAGAERLLGWRPVHTPEAAMAYAIAEGRRP